MIDVFVERKGNCLHTQFPIRMNELAVQLASIGIRQSVSKIPALGNEEIKVTMEALDEAGKAILARIKDSDSLGAVNHVSLAVNRTCPYGYREFLDMLAPKPGGEYEFYRKFDRTGPSSKTGIAGLLEETVRYTAMMSEYERVCREEEQAQEGEEDWER